MMANQERNFVRIFITLVPAQRPCHYISVSNRIVGTPNVFSCHQGSAQNLNTVCTLLGITFQEKN